MHFAALSAASASLSPSCSSSSCYDPHWSLYPRTYVAPRIAPSLQKANRIVVDGNLDKYPWNSTRVPWSRPFQDIQGAQGRRGSGTSPVKLSPLLLPVPLTQFKAVWDDMALYIAAILHPAPNLTTQAHYTERNSPIYQRDSDFEVFIDPTASTHQYKEVEINAINTVWNLLLDKPYADGGIEHSGRVAKPGEALFWDVSDQMTATHIRAGQVNDPSQQGAVWVVEMKWSFRDIMDRCDPNDLPVVIPPVPKQYQYQQWRINFSRVEKQGEINWTWQAQTVWDPELRAHVGKVQMHLPDAWGYLVLGSDINDDQDPSIETDQLPVIPVEEEKLFRDPTWPHRLAAMNVYYALHYYKDTHGVFTTDIRQLSLDESIIHPFKINITCSANHQSFLVKVHGIVDSFVASVLDDRLLRVVIQDEEGNTDLNSAFTAR